MPGSLGESLAIAVSPLPLLMHTLCSGILNTEHGACIVLPREDDTTRYLFPLTTSWAVGILKCHRLYTQLDISSTGAIWKTRQANDPNFQEAGCNLDIHSINP